MSIKTVSAIKFPDKYLLTGFTVMACLLLLYFSPYLLHLNDTMFASTGDGLKNFYTLAYYVKYDSGTWFTGMLYPYGEHVSFTDNQPLLAFVLRFIQHNFFDISPYLLGIANTLMFLNFFLCAFLLYKILYRLNLPATYSIACAVLITFISPTVYRLNGHYSLSYCFLIPLTIYLVMQYEYSAGIKKTLIAISLCLISFFSALLHPYWLIITAMMVILYALVKSIYERKIPVKLLLAGLSSLLLFKIFFLLTDPVNDRPQDPWGAAAYAAWTSSVFFPQFEFYDKLRNLLHIRKAEFEALAYVGIPGIVFTFFLIAKLASNVVTRKKLHFLPGSPFLKYFFCAGVLILMLAMFLPFRLGMKDLFYRIPFLNQFRSLGRFAWAFYFIFCIYYSYGFWVLFRKIRISKGVKVSGGIAIIFFLVWFSDLHFTLTKTKAATAEYGGSNILLSDRKVGELLSTSGYKPADFQAIFPLPIAADGSEKLWLSGGWLTKWSALPYSYQTHTPVLACIMSRTSIIRTLNFVSLTGSDYCEKKILNDFTSPLPVLVSVRTGETNRVLKKCREIAHDNDLTLYLLPLDSLKKLETVDQNLPEFVKQNFIFKNPYYTTDSSQDILYWTNHAMERDIAHPDVDAETLDKKKFEVKLIPARESYSLSCWIKVTPFGNKVPFFGIAEFDSAGNQLREKTITADRPEFDVFQDWIRFEDTLRLNLSTRKVEVVIDGKKSIVDHLLFKPESSTVVVIPEIPGRIYLNNYFAKVDSLPGKKMNL